MTAVVNTIVQKTEVVGTDSVTITDIVADGENFTREIRVFGPAVGGGAKPQVFTLRLTGSTEQSVKLLAPVQSF